MCGRFGFDMPTPVLEELFGVVLHDPIPPSWNITPGHPILAVALYEGRRELLGFHWGLIPTWAKDERITTTRGHANARSETVFDKPTFRDSARYHRCLVPASFFYEWKKTGSERVPHAIMLEGMAPFGMAAIYSEHDRLGPSLAILTCPPNALMRPIHDRMPVILAPKDFKTWLAPHAPQDDLMPLLMPYIGPMQAHAVSTRVNSPANNDQSLLEPIAAQGQLPLS